MQRGLWAEETTPTKVLRLERSEELGERQHRIEGDGGERARTGTRATPYGAGEVGKGLLMGVL